MTRRTKQFDTNNMSNFIFISSRLPKVGDSTLFNRLIQSRRLLMKPLHYKRQTLWKIEWRR